MVTAGEREAEATGAAAEEEVDGGAKMEARRWIRKMKSRRMFVDGLGV